MRGHHDQIATFHLRCIDNGLKRMCVLDVEDIAIYARFRGILHLFEVPVAMVAIRFYTIRMCP